MATTYRNADGINETPVSYQNPFPVTVMPDSPFYAISAIAIATPGGAASHSYVVGDTQPLVGGTYTEQGIATVTATQLVGVSVNAAGTGYAPADTIVPAGGTQTVAAELTVVTTKLITAAVNAAGTGYAPGQTITGTGATATTKPVFNITHTKAVSAAVVAGGTGGTPGAVTLTGTTGTGTKFQATGTIGGDGILAGDLVVTVAGDYTVNPTDVTAEPVTGGSLTGATVLVGMGVLTATIGNAGVFTANPAALTQDSTSGTGTGATFNTLVFGVNTISITGAGAFTANSATFTQGSTTGGGTGATFNAAYYGVHAATASEPGTYSIVPDNPVSQESSSGAGTGATFTLTFVEKPSEGTGIGQEWNPDAAAITVENSSHAANTCLGGLQTVTPSNGIANGGITLLSLGLRSTAALTGQVSLFVFHSAPAAAYADGGAFALSAADDAKLVTGSPFNVTLAATPGGVTQTRGVYNDRPIPFRLDTSGKFYVLAVNTSGGALTPDANGLYISANGYVTKSTGA